MLSQGTNLRSLVLQAREKLADGREKIRQQHIAGSPGNQVCEDISELTDQVVLEIYRTALQDLSEDGPDKLRDRIALVAHGGYGRREMAPYSDVDVMLLHPPDLAERIVPLAGRLLRDLGDAGLQVGHSVRTPQQALDLATSDATVRTTLMEARLLAGDQALCDGFLEQFRRVCRKNLNRVLGEIQEARSEERSRYGETIYLLEPNIKRSRGGLRDWQLLRWGAFARFGNPQPDRLRHSNHLSPADYLALSSAREFLLKLRNELHFQAKRSNDSLDRAEQLRIAEAWGYVGSAGLLPVELFMQDYFRHTQAVSFVASRFLERIRPGRWQQVWWGLLGHTMEGDFIVGPRDIRLTPRGMNRVPQDLERVLRLAELADLYNKPIDFAAGEAVREAVPRLSDHVTGLVAQRFLALLNHPVRLGERLQQLHEWGVLEKVIPAIGRVRGLVQFNEYHKYTIDEHCLLAVQKATEYHQDPGPMGRLYHRIKQKWLLHLALLLHDLGKGCDEDHSEVGARLALEIARRLRMSEIETETLVFLVHKHLLMSHLAFRRDTSDHEMLVKFAVEVGSPEVLRMLFLLTAADFAAVGPGVWNNWKAQVLSDLYTRTMRHLSAENDEFDQEDRLAAQRHAVRIKLDEQLPQPSDAWYHKQIETLPENYLLADQPAEIAAQLQKLRALPPGEVFAQGRYLPATGTLQYTVATHESITRGVFHKLAGAFTTKGIQILSADINTLGEGLVWDSFCVRDDDFQGPPPPARIEEVTRALVQALTTGTSPPLHRSRRYGRDRKRPELSTLQTHVRVDNTSSDSYTIVDVFAHDRPGLLYVIGRALFELDLSISLAKIGTHLDQVVDVFYVTDLQSEKVRDDERLRIIRQTVSETLQKFERDALEREAASKI